MHCLYFLSQNCLHISNKSSLRRRQWHPTPVLLPGKSHGQRSLVGCSPWGRYELDTTERLHFHFLLSCIGEGNGNPLQCSCLENPRNGGAWWAAVYEVGQSRTWLKRLSSSSKSSLSEKYKVNKYPFLKRPAKKTTQVFKVMSWTQCLNHDIEGCLRFFISFLVPSFFLQEDLSTLCPFVIL